MTISLHFLFQRIVRPMKQQLQRTAGPAWRTLYSIVILSRHLNKAEDVIKQIHRLDKAKLGYNFFYLTGISGAGRAVEGAVESAKIRRGTSWKSCRNSST